VERLAQVRGVGKAKAVQLKASAEFARRVGKPLNASPPRAIETADAADELIRPRLADKKQEHFVALLLDNRHRLIRLQPVAVGTLSASLVHPREVFKEAIASSAACVILAHNHPSGDPEPSDHDLTLTKRLVQAGKLLGIEVLDHLIVGSRRTLSLKAVGVVT
jgi:DNA repair protein RadC